MWATTRCRVTDGPRAGAYGWDGGFGSSWLVDSVRDLIVIVLTQRMFEAALAPQGACQPAGSGLLRPHLRRRFVPGAVGGARPARPQRLGGSDRA